MRHPRGIGRMRAAWLGMALLLALGPALASCSSSPRPIVVGAVYPLTGPQASGGIDEYRGVSLAVQMANAAGGVDGRPVQLQVVDTPSQDAAPGAVAELAGRGVRFVMGSYGSTISLPAAQDAASRGLLFWESGAVGDMAGAELGRLVFRVAPSGVALGRSAIDFIARRLAPELHRRATSLRFGVAGVDDVYGRAVARGALDEIRALHLALAGEVAYDANHLDPPAVVRRIAALRPDVLFVSAYMADGVALRRESIREHVPLVASIGTSSSYCMPQFGQALGSGAVGLFASDKPDGDALNTAGLTPSARALLALARARYRARYGEEMSAPALAGFSAGWALFHTVMPRAAALTPAGVAAAARAVRLPLGALPNGSGLRFGAPGSPDAGANLAAASVIWEWVGLDRRAVVWPPSFATQPIRIIPLEA